MRPRTGGWRKYNPSIKSPNHIIFCEHKRAVCSPHSILSAALICYVNRHIMHCCVFSFLFFFPFFYCGLQIGGDIWYGGSEDPDALLFSLIWLAVGHFVPLHSFMSPPSFFLWVKLFIPADDYLRGSKIYLYINRCILWKDFWANLSRARSLFQNLRLGQTPTMA